MQENEGGRQPKRIRGPCCAQHIICSNIVVNRLPNHEMDAFALPKRQSHIEPRINPHRCARPNIEIPARESPSDAIRLVLRQRPRALRWPERARARAGVRAVVVVVRLGLHVGTSCQLLLILREGGGVGGVDKHRGSAECGAQLVRCSGVRGVRVWVRVGAGISQAALQATLHGDAKVD